MSDARATAARTGIHALDRDTCLRLLADDEIGRLGVVQGSTPVVLPVNYVLDGEDIVLRTDPGTKLSYGVGTRCCFELDRFDRATRTGWSVLATGRLEEVTAFQPTTWERVRALPVDPWAGGAKEHWLRLVPDRLTGRALGPPPA